MLKWLILLIVACSPAVRAPRVLIHLVDPPRWSADDRRFVDAIGSVWSRLGFRFEVTDKPERSSNICPRDWAVSGVTDCTIDTGISRVDNMVATWGISGATDRATGEIRVDSKWTGYYLLAVLAHEIGHLLFSPGHLPEGAPGIMSRGTATWEASDNDLRLACRSIGRGC